MSHSIGTRTLVVAALFGVAACSSTEPTDGGSVVGVWQSSIPGDYEETIQFAGGGTWESVYADLDALECDTDAGTWVTEGGILSITLTTSNGVPNTGGEDIPYAVSGNTLTFDPAGGAQVFTSISSMVDCASYGFPR